jgi:arylsulfatase A-like enzyme
MILRGPGVVPGRFESVSRSIDVFPTLAGLAGVELQRAVEGDDLSGEIRRPTAVPHRERLGYSHTSLFSDEVWERYSRYESLSSRFTQGDPEDIWVGARKGDRMFKIRRGADGEWETVAFDLASDPDETVDVFDPADETDAEVAAGLERYKSALVAAHANLPEQRALDGERRLELLRGLGYVD